MDIIPQDSPSEVSSEEHPMISWARKKLSVLYWRLHATFPNLITGPHRDDCEYLRERDIEDNLETRVPPSESLKNDCIWGIEIFGPSEIDSLFDQLKNLGWDTPPIHRLGKGAVETLREWRTYGYTGNFSIGLVRQSTHSSRLDGYIGPVPKSVDYLLVEIIQITPEITGVLVGFRLNAEFSSAYEVELNTDRNYVHRPIFGKFTYATLGVELLKREAVDKIRADSKQMISTWFRRHLQGFFTLTSGGLRLPTAELLSCHSDVILTPKGHGTPEKAWCRLLTPYGFGDVWASLKYPGFRILSSEPVDDMAFHTIISIQISTLPAEEFSIYGGINSGTVVKFVHENLGDFLCQNALLYVLHEIQNGIKENRQKLNIKKSGYRGVTKSIERIKNYFEFSVGVPIILTDLQDVSERKDVWNSYKFLNSPLWPQEEPAQLSEVLRNHVKFLSKKTANEELSVREHFEQLASIMSVQESVKAQKRMECLTYLTIVLALGSLIVSLSPDTWIKETKNYLDSKINQKAKTPSSF